MPSRALISLVQQLVTLFLFTSVYNALPIIATPILVVAASNASGPTITTVSGAGHPVEIRQISPTTISPLFPGQSSTSSPSSASISDGGGSGYSPVSIIWIVFAILLALPLSFAGVRGYKLTSGTGIGLSLALLIWVTFVNSTSSGAELSTKSQNTSDLFLSLVIWGIFLIGCLGGIVRVGFLVGMNLLGACAGTALGILLVLLRPGLLVPIYAVNIIPLALLSTGGLLWPLWHQRLAVIVSSSTCGAFFIALATDLSLNKQSGISAGLKFLLDRNKGHITITLQAGYKPKISTLIIIGVSLALIPAFTFLQHRVWKGPFDRSEASMEKWKLKTNGAPIIGPGEDGFVSKDAKEEETAKPKVRFPSIIPTLPGNVPAPLPTKGGNGKVTAGGGYNGDGGVPIGGIVSPIYLAQQAEFQKNPPMPMQTVPGAGIGRLGFVGYWSNVGSNFAKRVSKRFSGAGGVGKRFSQMSAPSIYSMDVNQNGNGNPNAGRGWGWKPQPSQRPQQPQQPGGYGVPSSSSQRFVPARDETPGSVYGGMQVPQTKPLQLPNRVAQQQQQQPRSAAPAAPYNNNNNWGGQQQQQQRQNVNPPPPASLRTGRWNDVPSSRPPITPTTPSSSSRQAFPPSSQPQRQQQQQPMLLPSQLQRQQSSQNQRQAPPPSQVQQSQQGNRNRLKPSTRYNLL